MKLKLLLHLFVFSLFLSCKKINLLENNLKESKSSIENTYDNNLDDVIKYTTKNEMNWSQYFYDRNKGKGIIDDLRIIFYPPLLLVDSEMNILHKESGTSNLKEVKEILNIE